MAGDSSRFHEQVLSSSDRVGSLLELEDLKEIRRQVSSEVDQIRKAVSDKQRRDDAHHEQLEERVKTLQKKLARVEEEATHDPLTGVMNRGAAVVNRAHQGAVVSELSKARQMFRIIHAGQRGRNGLELTADFERGAWF